MLASEVATITYARELWAKRNDIAKSPKVLAWSASYENPAETPYMILDYVDGVTLLSRWTLIQGQDAGDALTSIRRIELSLHARSFSQNGSLYFAEDVPEELRGRPLYLTHEGDDIARNLAAKYRIGPTANREWWRDEYAHLDADRGPCTSYPHWCHCAFSMTMFDGTRQGLICDRR